MCEHTQEMLQIMTHYHNAIDEEILHFVNDILCGRDVIPLTVGFLTDQASETIQELTGKKVQGNRIVLDPNAVNHIEHRHGPNGVQDHSMQNIEDIARIGYVLANYDLIEYHHEHAEGYFDAEGKQAPKVIISKRIDGTYYVIEAASDARKHKNYIVSAYINKK